MFSSEPPVLPLTRFSVRDLPAMESASRRVLRSRIAETPLVTPSAGPSTAMPSAGTPATATPSAGTPMPSAGTPMPSAGTPFADSPLVPKAEPDVPPGPTVAPSHDVASPPPTGDVSEPPEPQLAPAVTTGADDISEQVYIRVSVDALAEMEALAHAPPQTLDPASKSRLTELQQVLRRFRQTETRTIASMVSRVRLSEVADAIDDESQRATEAEDRAAELQTLVNRLAASVPPTPAPASTAARHLIKIAEPAPFAGRRDALRQFRNQVTLALADHHRFADDQHRLRYVFQLLQGEALAVMEQHLQPDGHIAFATAQDLLAELTRVFGDSNEKATAARDLERLRQGNRDFSRYLADFTRLVSILGYEGQARRDALERGLSRELLEALRYEPEPADETATQYEIRLKRLDDRLRRYTGLANVRSTNRRTVPTASEPRASTDVPRGRVEPLSAEERDERLASGLCFRCGGPDHKARDCPLRSAPAPRTTPAGTGRAVPPRAAAEPRATADSRNRNRNRGPRAAVTGAVGTVVELPDDESSGKEDA